MPTVSVIGTGVVVPLTRNGSAAGSNPSEVMIIIRGGLIYCDIVVLQGALTRLVR